MLSLLRGIAWFWSWTGTSEMGALNIAKKYEALRQPYFDRPESSPQSMKGTPARSGFSAPRYYRVPTKQLGRQRLPTYTLFAPPKHPGSPERRFANGEREHGRRFPVTNEPSDPHPTPWAESSSQARIQRVKTHTHIPGRQIKKSLGRSVHRKTNDGVPRSADAFEVHNQTSATRKTEQTVRSMPPGLPTRLLARAHRSTMACARCECTK